MERNITSIVKMLLVVTILFFSVLPVDNIPVGGTPTDQKNITADFTWSPLEPNKKTDIVIFNGSSSTIIDDEIVNWAWDFGDGATAHGETIEHVYNAAGCYLVNLAIRGSNDTVSWKTDTIHVKNTVPTAGFTYLPSNNLTISTAVEFTDNSTDEDGNISSWYWDFGDDNTSTVQHPSHVYMENGTYIVCLVVWDDDNATDSVNSTLVVGSVPVASIPSVADFSYNPMVNITINTTITFTDNSTDGDGNISSWSWDFGDGTNSTIQNPTHQYSKEGTYRITLTVTDNNKNSNTAHITLYIIVTKEKLTDVHTLKYNIKNKGQNYIAWKGDSITASNLIITAGLSEGESISIFDANTGQWKRYFAETSNSSDDFNINSWDIIIIDCETEKNIVVDALKKQDKTTRTIKLNYNYDSKNETGNPGYNYIAWSKEDTVKASVLATTLDLSDGQSISKLNIETNQWFGYIVGLGLEDTPLDFTIYKDDIICIKVSQEKVLKI